MSEEYNRFAGQAFGPVLAEVSRESYRGRITATLMRRMRAAWGLTGGAETEVLRVARGILQVE